MNTEISSWVITLCPVRWETCWFPKALHLPNSALLLSSNE